jgi:hypothetical protein
MGGAHMKGSVEADSGSYRSDMDARGDSRLLLLLLALTIE